MIFVIGTSSFTKNRLDSDNIKKSEVDRIISGLLNILESILKLCHPFMPFITEEIWNQIASGKKQSFLLNQSFPKKVRISGSKYKEIENLKTMRGIDFILYMEIRNPTL